MTRCGIAKEARLLAVGFVGWGTAMSKWKPDSWIDMLGPKEGGRYLFGAVMVGIREGGLKEESRKKGGGYGWSR